MHTRTESWCNVKVLTTVPLAKSAWLIVWRGSASWTEIVPSGSGQEHSRGPGDVLDVSLPVDCGFSQMRLEELKMAQKGKTQLTIIFTAPPDLVSEGDRLFASHADWMVKS